jgi:general nucleoside transport system permease protein
VNKSPLTPTGEPIAVEAVVGKRRIKISPSTWTYLAPLIGAAAGLLIGAFLIMLSGANPFSAYRTMVLGAFGGYRQITETILRTTPLLFMGLGLTVAFRCRAWNIGGEGQFLMGTLAGGMVGIYFQHSLPAFLLIPAMLLGGIIGGSLWAGLAAMLKIKRGINEIITTLMLNYVAHYFIAYLARGPLKDPNSFLPQSIQLVGAARLPTFFDTRFHIGILIAVLLVPLVYILIWKTPLGFRLRAVGSNEKVARFAGMNVPLGIAFALIFSGAMAGLSGIVEMSAVQPRLRVGISGNYGFTGIMVALLGRLHPVGVLIAAFFFAALTIGAQSMHAVYGLPIALAQVIHALVVLFVLAADALARFWRK